MNAFCSSLILTLLGVTFNSFGLNVSNSNEKSVVVSSLLNVLRPFGIFTLYFVDGSKEFFAINRRVVVLTHFHSPSILGSKFIPNLLPKILELFPCICVSGTIGLSNITTIFESISTFFESLFGIVNTTFGSPDTRNL